MLRFSYEDKVFTIWSFRIRSINKKIILWRYTELVRIISYFYIKIAGLLHEGNYISLWGSKNARRSFVESSNVSHLIHRSWAAFKPIRQKWENRKYSGEISRHDRSICFVTRRISKIDTSLKKHGPRKQQQQWTAFSPDTRNDIRNFFHFLSKAFHAYCY